MASRQVAVQDQAVPQPQAEGGDPWEEAAKDQLWAKSSRSKPHGARDNTHHMQTETKRNTQNPGPPARV